MTATGGRQERQQSRREETANSVSHGVGLVAALAAIPPMLAEAAESGDPSLLAGTSVFAGSMLLLYLTSAVYHALTIGRTKALFKKIEHSAIFVLIAGTYTPFTLGVLRGPWGWSILVLVWSMAAAGTVLKFSRGIPNPIVSTGLYLLMGWLAVFAIDPLLERMEPQGLLWLFGGGLAYSGGTVFFALDSRVRFAHFVWHLFVLAGTACHYCAVRWYAI